MADGGLRDRRDHDGDGHDKQDNQRKQERDQLEADPGGESPARIIVIAFQESDTHNFTSIEQNPEEGDSKYLCIRRTCRGI
jgi:hypothetical protein